MANQKTQMTKLTGGKMVTPVGTARFAYIDHPDDSVFGKGRYRLTIVFDKTDPEFVTFAKKVAALNKVHEAATGRKASGLPLKLVTEKMSKGKDGKSGTGDPVGAPYIELVANGSTRDGVPLHMPTYNAKGEEESLLVYGGDTVRANCTFMGWELADGVGVKGYLNSVQLLKSNWSNRGAGFSDMSAVYGDDESVAEDNADDLDDEGDDEVLHESRSAEALSMVVSESPHEYDADDDDDADPLDQLLG